MKLDSDTVPTWPFYVVLYVVAGLVVTRSLTKETGRQCGASSPLTVQEQVWYGMFWPVTAAGMVVNGMDPMAAMR